MHEKIDTKEFSRKTPVKNTVSKTINLTEKNYFKVKSKKVNLSGIVNAFIESHDAKYLELEFSDRVENNSNRVVASISIKKDNLKKALKTNLSALVNAIIERF